MGGKRVSVVKNEHYSTIERQWDRESNDGLELSSLSQVNRTPVFFRCLNCNKPFKKSIKYVIKSGGIILCAPCHRVSINAKIGKANAISNKKDITAERAARLGEIVPQWDEEKNGESIHGDGIRTYSSYWWRCSLNHSWNTSLKARFNGNNCPYCSNRKVLPGYNDLATTHPELAKWYSESNELSVREIMAASKASVLWSDHGHEWSGVVREMASNPSCHYCSGKKVLPGLNDLATRYPEVAEQWNYARNEESPSNYLGMSGQKAWWICSEGHEWSAQIHSRTMGRGCPICSNYLIIPGENDLASQCPDLMAQWHWDKNTGIDPSTLALGSSVVAWWRCDRGHEWKTRITERARGHKRGCKRCSNLVSNAEKEVLEYLVDLGVPRDEMEANTRKVIPPKEIDIYIPSLRLAIEYNGAYWHSNHVKKDTQYHYDKWLACKRRGIRLIIIWEMDWINSPHEIKEILAKAVKDSKESNVEIRMSRGRKSDTSSFHYEVLLHGTIMEVVRARALNDGSVHLSSNRSTEFLGEVARRIKEDLSPRSISMELRNDDQEWRGLVREGFSMVGEVRITPFKVRKLRRIAVGDSTIENNTLTIFDAGVSSWLWEGDIPLTPP